MKRVFSCVVAASLALSLLAGCGASASSSTTEQASSSQATAQTTTADGKSVIRVGSKELKYFSLKIA